MNINDKLIRACKYGQIEVVKLALKQGADVHALNDEELRWTVVKLLLEHGANL